MRWESQWGSSTRSRSAHDPRTSPSTGGGSSCAPSGWWGERPHHLEYPCRPWRRRAHPRLLRRGQRWLSAGGTTSCGAYSCVTSLGDRGAPPEGPALPSSCTRAAETPCGRHSWNWCRGAATGVSTTSARSRGQLLKRACRRARPAREVAKKSVGPSEAVVRRTNGRKYRAGRIPLDLARSISASRRIKRTMPSGLDLLFDDLSAKSPCG